MRTAELLGAGDVRLRTADRPRPAADEVLVEIAHVGICGSDLHWYEHGRMGDRIVEEPLVLGHESAGHVAEVGSAVEDLSVGERVTLEPGVPCRRCKYCRSGRYNLCPDVSFMATPGTDGAFREYVAWPADFVHALPDAISTRDGALCEPISVGLQAVDRGDVDVGDSVLVVGAGPIGTLVMACARAAGASEIAVTDIVDSKLDRALAFGADHAIDGRADDVGDRVRDRFEGGADVVIEASGARPAVETAIDSVGRDGTVVLVGLAPEAEVPISTFDLVRGQVDVRGSYRFANRYADAISLLSARAIDVDALVDFTSPLAEIESALERASDPTILKGMVSVGGD